MSIKKQAKKFLSRIEKHIATQSNPHIINQILLALNLNELETKDQDFKDFLHKISTRPIDLTALLTHVKSHILDNEPLCALLAFIQENDLIGNEELAQAATTLQLRVFPHIQPKLAMRYN